MNRVLDEFWKRMRVLKLDLGAYQLAQEGVLEPQNCIPICSHTDEGRSLKINQSLFWAPLACLGGKTSYLVSQRRKAPLSRNGLGMNFVSAPMASHFIYACFLTAVSDKHPGSLEKLIGFYSEDLEPLLLNGVTESVSSQSVLQRHQLRVSYENLK